VIHGPLGDETDCLFVDPFPECDVFVHNVGFEFGFEFEIEDLELSLCFEGNDFGGGMHYRTVCRDGSSHDRAIVVKIDDDNLICLVDFFADTAKTSQIETK